MESKNQQFKNNQLTVAKMKVESEIKLDQLDDEKKEDLKVKTELVEAIQDQRYIAAEKVQEVKQDKKKIRDEINTEITEALKRKREEEALDLARKEELI